MQNNNDVVNQLITAGAWISEKGWVPATGGNFSARLADGVVVTASGYDKGCLTEASFCQFDLEGNQFTGAGKPSAETALHLAIYQLDAHAKAVLHTHSIAATTLSRYIAESQLAIHGYEMQKSLAGIQSHLETVNIAIFDNDQDIDALVGQVNKVHAKQPLRHGILIRGHGLYVWGDSILEARRHLEGLEFLFMCELERFKLQG
ncbi:Methylthioribulose-1-phosphate dehydratase [Piscirickettsia salmonis]|uniref:Methylthioribulose-1-phosphate dehydratase n=1 Tax=Piscirickettsia salmonis TaxID=1238 RepID=A0A1L6TEB9_PISSA|nr:methylthioribulose 1-phosphate dehydratase [Piscirickettsia salmonis]AKP72695.1 methylthioribulose-1-phosphate dehydratase [Piscirickettsia salmonis LF-89 = ATCC VR-1361]ALB23806.1 methylthioribulose-1-phosphate dehydratase [Piscirickettsia salmonis]ALY03651.1 methylthioribulose-1-phosphate dehydratase [Piscirickettsia salmonis]AMA43213.1 methylthioribulose-1-phosphate dehydratase [Piscirickettsia salmonis]AOS35683.1 methylthioribulose-1-phosphate dehydratase [Piscirickettsia salmonis]